MENDYRPVSVDHPSETSTSEASLPKSRFPKRFAWAGVIVYFLTTLLVNIYPDSEVIGSGLVAFFAPLAYPPCWIFQQFLHFTDSPPDLTNWGARWVWLATTPIQWLTYWFVGKLLAIAGRWIKSLRPQRSAAADESSSSDPS